MDRRTLGYTLVREMAGQRAGRLVSVVPRAVSHVLGVKSPRYMAWDISGRYCRVTPHARRVPGSVPFHDAAARVCRISPDAAQSLGLKDGGLVEWMVAAGRGNRWEVHARAGSKGHPRSGIGKTWRTPKQGGGINRRPVAINNAYYYRHAARGGITRVTVPKPALLVLGACGPGHIRWTRAGSYLRMVPCTGTDPGSRGLRVNAGSSNSQSHATNLPGDAAKALRGGPQSQITWYVASDGRGRWEIHARGSA